MKRLHTEKSMTSSEGSKGTFSVDRNYTILDANKATKTYLKTNRLNGQICYKIFFGFSKPCPSCPVSEVFRTGKPSSGSCYDAKRKRFLSLSAVPNFNPETGEVEGAIETFRNISGVFEDNEVAKSYEHAMLMLDALPICCGLFNKHMQMIDCNNATVNFFQCTGKIEICERIFDMFPERQPDGRLSTEAALIELNKAFENSYNKVEWYFLLPDGELVPTEVTVVKISCGTEEMLATYTRDLREEKALRAAHDDANERMRLMFDATPLCCNFWDEKYNNIDCNQEAVRLFDLSSKKDYLNRFPELSPKNQPDGAPSAQKALQNIKKAFEHGYRRFEWMHQKLNGEPIPAEITLVRIKRGDRFIVAGYTRDLRQEKLLLKASEAALMESQIDPLTRLYNKSAAKMLIENELGFQDTSKKHALICIDIDNFKSINDDFGHLFGDDVLIEVSNKIKCMFRSSDILGRFGGDEFVLLIKNIPNIDFIEDKIKNLCMQINKRYKVNNIAHTISASAGISIYPDDGLDYNELYKNADEASYYAKRTGKNKFVFYNNRHKLKST